MTIQIDTADKLTLPDLTRLFNDGYAGYMVPVDVNEDYITSHIRQFDVRLDLSPVAFFDERPVAFALLAVRGSAGWVAGVGTAAKCRQQGLGRRLMLDLFDRARAAGLVSIQLEVIVGNDAAHRLYESVGMHDMRRLLVLERLPADIAAVHWDGVLEFAEVKQALSEFDALHTAVNPWQRQPASIHKMSVPATAYLARRDGRVVAYLIGSFGDERVSILDVGVASQADDALIALLISLHSQYPHARATLTNLDEHDAAWPVLETLGYRAYLSQNEMRIAL